VSSLVSGILRGYPPNAIDLRHRGRIGDAPSRRPSRIACRRRPYQECVLGQTYPGVCLIDCRLDRQHHADMAMLPCRECGRDVSSEAVSCPHCGVPSPTRPTPTVVRPAGIPPTRQGKGGGVHAPLPPARVAGGGTLLLIFIGLIVLVSFIGNQSSTSRSSSRSWPSYSGKCRGHEWG
jgi:hypothetical protein